MPSEAKWTQEAVALGPYTSSVSLNWAVAFSLTG